MNTRIRNKEDLFLHRNAVSHPVTVDWRSEEMHAFKKAKRDWRDNRPTLLWDLHRSMMRSYVRKVRSRATKR